MLAVPTFPETSPVRTFAADGDIPPLPLPTLRESCELFLQCVEPFCDDQEMNEARAATEQLCDPNGVGPRLQSLLESKSDVSGNYVADWWLNVAYHSSRDSLVPLEGMAIEWPTDGNCDQCQSAALHMSGSYYVYERLMHEAIPPDGVAPDQPWNMSAYRNLFCSVRIPGHPVDRLVSNFKTTAECAAAGVEVPVPYFIVAFPGGRFFAVPMIDVKTKRRLTVGEVCTVLRDLQQQAPSLPSSEIGWLTAAPRRTWAQARECLASHTPVNQRSLELIGGALAIMILDEAIPADPVARAVDAAAASDQSSHWNDLGQSWTVYADGTIAGGMQHSAMDAVPSFRQDEYIFKYMEDFLQGGGSFAAGQVNYSSQAEFLRWEVPSSLGHVHRAVQSAKDAVARIRDGWDVQGFQLHDFGGKSLRSLRVSPDSFVQMAIQLAYDRCHGGDGAGAPTYESVGTLRYRHGRTETGRSVSKESVAFVKAMKQPNLRGGSKVEHLRRAISAHSRRMRQAAAGKGFDRHFFALRCACTEQGLDVPPLFSSKAYKKMSNIRLSTSHVTNRVGNPFPVLFHPVSEESIGIVYSVNVASINCTVMTIRSSGSTCSSAFKAALHGALVEMFELLRQQRLSPHRKAKL